MNDGRGPTRLPSLAPASSVDSQPHTQAGSFLRGKCVSGYGAFVWCARETLWVSRGGETQAQTASPMEASSPYRHEALSRAPVPSPASVSPSGKWEFSTCGHLHILLQWNSVYIQSSPPGITFCLQDFTFTSICNGILLLWSGTPLSINKRLLLNGTQRTVKRWPPTYHVCK